MDGPVDKPLPDPTSTVKDASSAARNASHEVEQAVQPSSSQSKAEGAAASTLKNNNTGNDNVETTSNPTNSSSGGGVEETSAQQQTENAQTQRSPHYVHHTAHEAYSGHNKIPTISEYEEGVRKREQEQQAAAEKSKASGWGLHHTAKDETAKGGAQKTEGEQEKEEMMKRMRPQGRPIDNVAKKGERYAHDPVTDSNVLIKDADFKDFSVDDTPTSPTKMPKKKSPTVSSFKSASPRTSKDSAQSSTSGQTFINPSHAKIENILMQQFPATPEDHSIGNLAHSFDLLAIGLSCGITVIWFFTSFGSGIWKFIFRTSLCVTVGILSWFALGVWHRRIEKDIQRLRAEVSRQRGEDWSPPTPESVEWLNALIKVFWGLVNAEEMFKSVVDMVEDIMQASLPGFVDAVKISEVGQGVNPIRIVAMRGLPDQPGDKDYPKEEWIDQNDSGKDSKDTVKKEDENGEAQDEDGEDSGELTDQSGDYVNLEVSFVYQAMPGKASNLRQSNIHLLVQFFLGLYDWLHIPVPIWIQIEGIAGTARLRLQFIEQPPFVRNLTFTLMGVPAVEVSAIPMTTKLPNVLDLPVVSSFFKSAVAAGTAEYCAPKSMTLNLAEILTGTGVKMDTKAVGVFVVTIHHGSGLSVQDTGGSSDPYIVVAYAKFGKPLYSTRIIFEDLNPVFEETAFLLLDEDSIQSDEDLSLTLWDNDKRSADDLIGRVQVPVKELIKRPNVKNRRTDQLKGFEDADEMMGELEWSVAYYEKATLNPALSTAPGAEKLAEKKHTPRESNTMPSPQKPLPASSEKFADKVSKETSTLQEPDNAKKETETADEKNADPKEDKEEAEVAKPEDITVLNTRPDEAYPSGVVSIVIHFINNLERQNLKGASGSGREGAAGQDTDEPSEQAGNLPNSYCEIILNDDMVYKTRVKQYTSMPFFEAGTERFVADWRNAVVRVVVRDARLREHDPVLGIVNLNLSELFKESSQVTRMFAIQEGVGFGRANISFLWRSVQAKIPRNLRGWDTGTVQIVSPITVTLNGEESSNDFEGKRLKIWTSDVDFTLSGKSSKKQNGAVTWESKEEDLRLPVYRRHQTSMVFEIGGKDGVVSALGTKPKAVAVLWLNQLVDNEQTEVKLDVIVSDKADNLRQNAITDFTAKNHKYAVVGKLSCEIALEHGLDPDHEAIANKKGQSHRHAYDAYDRIEGQAALAEKNAHAMDDGVIDKRERKEMARAHKRALALRHRGAMQYAPYRSALWMKDGIKAHGASLRKSISGSTGGPSIGVESES